eukprot:8172253-Pyramimonas_sp.AAC.1
MPLCRAFSRASSSAVCTRERSSSCSFRKRPISARSLAATARIRSAFAFSAAARSLAACGVRTASQTRCDADVTQM